MTTATYARVVQGIVVEVYQSAAGQHPGDCFVPELAAQFIPCPALVQAHWHHRPDGSFAPAPRVESTGIPVSDPFMEIKNG